MREELASLSHDIWASWMVHLFSCCNKVGDGCMEIPRNEVDKWMRQINTPYEQLQEYEKESDRDQADKIIKLLLGLRINESLQKENKDLRILIAAAILSCDDSTLYINDEVLASMANDIEILKFDEPANRRTVLKIRGNT